MVNAGGAVRPDRPAAPASAWARERSPQAVRQNRGRRRFAPTGHRARQAPRGPPVAAACRAAGQTPTPETPRARHPSQARRQDPEDPRKSAARSPVHTRTENDAGLSATRQDRGPKPDTVHSSTFARPRPVAVQAARGYRRRGDPPRIARNRAPRFDVSPRLVSGLRRADRPIRPDAPSRDHPSGRLRQTSHPYRCGGSTGLAPASQFSACSCGTLRSRA